MAVFDKICQNAHIENKGYTKLQGYNFCLGSAAQGGSYTVPADNLFTKVNNRLVCDDYALGLAAGEYITGFRFEFGSSGTSGSVTSSTFSPGGKNPGTVQPGFREVGAPYIFVRLCDDLPNEYQFVSRPDVGGCFGGK